MKYAKQYALYGEVYRDEVDLRAYVKKWLDKVATVRTDGTIVQQP